VSNNGRPHLIPGAPKPLPPEARGGIVLPTPSDERKLLNEVLQAGHAMATWPNVAGMLPLAIDSSKAQPSWQRAAILCTLVALAECQAKIQEALTTAESGRRQMLAGKPETATEPQAERAPTCAGEVASAERLAKLASLDPIPEPAAVAPLTELKPQENHGSERNQG